MGHISPEAYEGGTIGLVEDGDEITIDVPRTQIELKVSEERAGKAQKNGLEACRKEAGRRLSEYIQKN